MKNILTSNAANRYSARSRFLVCSTALFASCAFFLWQKVLHGKFDPTETFVHVMIDGVDYGIIDHIHELTDLPVSSSDEHYTKITLKRDFVTDPSLYHWARKSVESKQEPKDIDVVVKTRKGKEISRFLLKKSKPLQWTLEVTDQNTGGFHEKIEFAIQEIAIR